ncbi:hypothetical protein [Sagittula sp. SSi028]|uniref:hypothetical protein n=1 Tax=Sagittula sp. SSi028 TaxID=3400636 RepID=UPI003AF5CF96
MKTISKLFDIEAKIPTYIPSGVHINHGPFLTWLVRTSHPKCVVTLNDHTGYAHFAICETVRDCSLPTECYLFRSTSEIPEGDEPSEDFLAEHGKYVGTSHVDTYSHEAPWEGFEDGSIDVLYISGTPYKSNHSFQFSNWERKLSGSAVVVFHDCTKSQSQYSAILRGAAARYIHINTKSYNGLSVSFQGSNSPEKLRLLQKHLSNSIFAEVILSLFQSWGSQTESAGLLHKKDAKNNLLLKDNLRIRRKISETDESLKFRREDFDDLKRENYALRVDLANERLHPTKSLVNKYMSIILFFLSGQKALFGKKRLEKFKISAKKRNPNRSLYGLSSVPKKLEKPAKINNEKGRPSSDPLTGGASSAYRELTIDPPIITNKTKLSFCIKVDVSFEIRIDSEEGRIADALSTSLKKLGHTVRIDFDDQRYLTEDSEYDAIIVLRGLSGYTPNADTLSIMWNITHPEQVSYEEYALFDIPLVASRSYAALLSFILERPIFPLLHCVESSKISGRDELDYEEGGNHAHQGFSERTTADAFDQPDENGRIVQVDHTLAMKDFGFIAKAAFDTIGCGKVLATDQLPALDALLGSDNYYAKGQTPLSVRNWTEGRAASLHRAMASYIDDNHSFTARAEEISGMVKGVLRGLSPAITVQPNFGAATPRRRVGVLLQRGSAWWTTSAYIRLIAPLTTDYAYETAGIDLVALDGVDDPRLNSCDICIVQRIAVAQVEDAERLIKNLQDQNTPLYVDNDDAFGLHDARRKADQSLKLLMSAAKEVWFSTPTLAKVYVDVAAGKSRVRKNNLDPRFWRNYGKEPRTKFTKTGPIRFVYMGSATHHEDLASVMPAFQRLAQDYPGQFELTLVGITSDPPEVDWLKILNPRKNQGGYPAFVRFITRDRGFDVGIAPLVPTQFNAAKSDIKFLDYSAMGLLSVVADNPAYRDCIDAGLAIGCASDEQAWYDTLSQIIENRFAFAEMRTRAHRDLWQNRSTLTDPDPLADLLK